MTMTGNFKYNVAFPIKLVFIPLVGEIMRLSDLSFSVIWETELPSSGIKNHEDWNTLKYMRIFYFLLPQRSVYYQSDPESKIK